MNKKFVLISAIVILVVAVGVVGFRFVIHGAKTTSTTHNNDINMDNLRHVSLKVDGMRCAFCAFDAKNKLRNIPGIVDTEIGFVGIEGRGEVVYDKTKTNPYEIIQAILPLKGTTLSDEVAQTAELAPLLRAPRF